MVAQHACSARQLGPVAVEVEVAVLVAELVGVGVGVVVQAAGAQVPVPVGGVFAAVTQAERVSKQAAQVIPAAVMRYWVEQFVSHVIAVESQGHCSSQVMKSAQAPPVKLPLA
jgi:Flp pilus assembly protein TadB